MAKANKQFHRATLEDYTDDLLAEKSLLVINPVNSKCSSYESVTDEIDYTLVFNFWKTPDETSYRRYCWETCDRTTYKNTIEGTQFYLVLWPGGNVRACFPKSSTELPSQLAPVLKRDAHYTGNPCSLKEEEAVLKRDYERRWAKLTPEERRHQDITVTAYRHFSSLQDKVIIACIPVGFLMLALGLLALVKDYAILGYAVTALGICAIPLVMLIFRIFEKRLYEHFYRKTVTAEIQTESLLEQK